jgi:hypothetical protein
MLWCSGRAGAARIAGSRSSRSIEPRSSRAISSGGSRRTQLAASSIASGIPETASTMSSTAPRWLASAKPRCAERRARSNSFTASKALAASRSRLSSSGSARPASGNNHSCPLCKRAREVTSRQTDGAAPISDRPAPAARRDARRCRAPAANAARPGVRAIRSTGSRVSFDFDAEALRQPCDHRRDVAQVLQLDPGAAPEQRGAACERMPREAALADATGPSKVSNWQSARASIARSSASSAARPTKPSASTGRLGAAAMPGAACGTGGEAAPRDRAGPRRLDTELLGQQRSEVAVAAACFAAMPESELGVDQRRDGHLIERVGLQQRTRRGCARPGSAHCCMSASAA